MAQAKAYDAIVSDLTALSRSRRSRFVVGLVLVAPLMAAVVWAMGVRADLWARPVLQVGAQFSAFALGLFVLPAMGVGLLPSSHRSRVLVLMGCVMLGLVGALGWPGLHADTLRPYTCLLLGTGAIALVTVPIAILGARQRVLRSIVIIAAGLALAQLNLLTCLCPYQLDAYPLSVHVGTALAILVAAGLLGLVAQLVRRP
ncbi:MAG: hypothetical protein V3V08_18890 [Nannocystaceae bacterium]